MKERPILFSAPMIRALLDGSKTQTRRIVKPQPDEDGICKLLNVNRWEDTSGKNYTCPYGVVGSELWVRETFGLIGDKDNHVLHYRATHWKDGNNMGWKPSIHMPRWASRIQLEITDIRVERLHDISEKDAIAEGLKTKRSENGYLGVKNYLTDEWVYDIGFTPRLAFKSLWEKINGADSFGANPFCWVIEFRVIKP